MQQSAVRWLHGVRLHHRGQEVRRDLVVTLALVPPVIAPWVHRVAELPAGASLELPLPELPLLAEAIANQIESERGAVVVTVAQAGAVLLEHRSEIAVLACNEWPGVAPHAALLAAFVTPNHPALLPLLQRGAERLAAATGSSALDGYQSGSPARARAIAAAMYDAMAELGITYASAPPSFERRGQKIRTPEQLLGDRLGTCLDLALVHAALCEHAGLHPFVVLLRGHAFAGVWLQPVVPPQPDFGPAVELRKRLELDALLVVETTLACQHARAPFVQAVGTAVERLRDEAAFELAIDVQAARRAGIRPLPVRTQAFLPGPELMAAPPAAGGAAAGSAPPEPAGRAPAVDPGPPLPPPSPPKDRLEHWKQKLLDLSMFNRLLNFVPTKKSVPLCAHDLDALEDRLQQGTRVRILPRPELGDRGEAPRDLALASQQAGVDLVQRFLAESLRAGRLHADLDEATLDERLVEIYRHARSSLEETGANTLHLAIGFLKYYETRESTKPRRAPLLLLPLVAERSSVQDGVRFLLDDAEPRLNPTLQQYLATNFELRVPLGDTPPEGELGVDVQAVLAAWRQVALGMPRWEVEATACLGFFSFTKYLMWLDLADRDALLQSPVLQHLVTQPNAVLPQRAPELPRDELDDLDPADVFCPKDADSSQLAAVLSAAGGRSFVLEGPPGTGKSQTITNLIAHALGHGKRVLFVAEKRAALEVVQRRLAEVGLGPFCLELHSSKSGPKAVLEQLRRALEVGQRREPEEWRAVAHDQQVVRRQLQQVVHDLHRPREHGSSVFAAMAELVALPAPVPMEWPELPLGEPAAVATAATAVATLAGAALPLGVPAAAPWWGCRRADWTPAFGRSVEPAAERLARATATLSAALAPVATALGLGPVFGVAGPSRAQWSVLLELVRWLGAPSLPPAAWLPRDDWRMLAAELEQASDLGRRAAAMWSPLSARWRRELLALDLDALHAEYAASAEAFVVLRWWQLRQAKATLQAAVLGTMPAATVVRDDLDAARGVRATERTLSALAAARSALGPQWRDGQADWPMVAGWVQQVQELRRLLLALEPGALVPRPACLQAFAAVVERLAVGGAELAPQLGALRVAQDEFAAALAASVDLLALDPDLAFAAPTQPGWLAAVAARLERWRSAWPQLRDHCAYHGAAVAARAAGVAPLVEAHADGSVTTAVLVPTFRARFLQAWLDRVHAAEPALARFRGVDHERAIARFQALDRRSIQLAADVVRARLSAQLPQLRDTTVASSELGILEREIKKQRKHKPVRRLLAEIPGLWRRLAPCVLMSPLSVAQFLGRAGQRFDLVVFDEASQIPMWDAVGAIGRGTSLVVVGDSRQLPPTSFFQRQAQGDDIGSDEIPEDLESVLDECATAGLPRQHLDWHYRSRHESLIAFSNHHYYQNRLLTFPAPAAIAPGLGVRCVRVAGVYDRANAQHNRIEADALVAEVKARLLDPARVGQSLGIVTFSQAQQVLIEDLLDRARRTEPALEAAFQSAVEPVFVKNLENVQGDERDVILFSICYGPDAQGRVHENYGPLNLQGGERRLNVAVTRARTELVVFTSLGPEQVAQRSAALGARHLRAFLDYAMRGPAALPATASRDPGRGVESPFEAAVCRALQQRGHEVHTQVGCSGYRIDLAVVDPAAPGRYLLGIECDGATYHAAATVRDRDRLRSAVLRGLGWQLHRIWSTDFWQDPLGELARVEQAIAAAAAAARAADAAAAARLAHATPAVAAPAPAGELPSLASAAAGVPPPWPRTEPPAAAPSPAVGSLPPTADPTPTPPPPAAALPPPDPDGPRPYTEAALPRAGTPEQFQLATALRTVRGQLERVLAAEAPVQFDRLARTVAAAWDLARLTDRVRERVRQALPAAAVVDGDLVWSSAEQRATFRGFRVPQDGEGPSRSAEELPPPEIEQAMLWLLRQHQALAADDLARETARCFAITRLGTVVREVMAAALASGVARGLLLREQDVVRTALRN